MINIEHIEAEYNRIKNNDTDTHLLSLEKIISLEKAKQEIIDKYLSKINKIDESYNIITNDNFTIDEIINFAKNNFGEINFLDNKFENNERIIYYAFHFCIISIIYLNDEIKYKVNVFWDL